MIRNNIFICTFIIAVLSVNVQIGLSQKKSNLKGDISLSGAFALYPMAVKWAEEFKKIHPQVRIDISGGGAGKGMTDALAKVVDLGMVSREIHEEEYKKGAVGFAVVKDAVIPTINASNPLISQIKRRGLKKSTAKLLWSDKLSYWGQVLGTKNKIPIHVFTRSDACGAGDTWAAWFGLKQEDLEGTAVFGDPGIAATVQKDKVAIGYNNIAYVYDQKTGKPFSGMMVMPIDINNNGKIEAQENFYDNIKSLMQAIGDGRYPSPPARDLYLVSNGVPTNPVVVEFIKFILTQGQKYAPETGYISLPSTTIQKELSKFKRK